MMSCFKNIFWKLCFLNVEILLITFGIVCWIVIIMMNIIITVEAKMLTSSFWFFNERPNWSFFSLIGLRRKLIFCKWKRLTIY